jgi:hypothetical protein
VAGRLFTADGGKKVERCGEAIAFNVEQDLVEVSSRYGVLPSNSSHGIGEKFKVGAVTLFLVVFCL